VTVALSVLPALVRLLAGQCGERDGVEQRLIPGCFRLALSGSVGSQRFGTNYRCLHPATGMLTRDRLPDDLAAESLGAQAIRLKTIEGFRAATATATARAADHTTALHIDIDPLARVPSSQSWSDVPVSEVAALDSTQQARKTYEVHKREQTPLIGGAPQ